MSEETPSLKNAASRWPESTFWDFLTFLIKKHTSPLEDHSVYVAFIDRSQLSNCEAQGTDERNSANANVLHHTSELWTAHLQHYVHLSYTIPLNNRTKPQHCPLRASPWCHWKRKTFFYQKETSAIARISEGSHLPWPVGGEMKEKESSGRQDKCTLWEKESELHSY